SIAALHGSNASTTRGITARVGADGDSAGVALRALHRDRAQAVAARAGRAAKQDGRCDREIARRHCRGRGAHVGLRAETAGGAGCGISGAGSAAAGGAAGSHQCLERSAQQGAGAGGGGEKRYRTRSGCGGSGFAGRRGRASPRDRTTRAATGGSGAMMSSRMMSSKKITSTKIGSAKKIVRASLLALLIVSCASVASLRAQEQPASSDQPASVSSADKPQAPGRQLAHESKEAAGTEKDEMEEFKHSASVQAIHRLTGLSVQQSYWLCVILNFAVIAAVFIWAGRKYLPGMFRDRSAAIQKAMQEAQMASEEARRRLAEIESRLMKLDVEIGMMRDAAEKEGAAEEARIQATAEEDARKIVVAAEQEIAAAAKAARRQLTAYAADLAVGLARKQIHVDAGTDQALVRNFAGQLGM